MAPSRALDSPHALLPEQRNKDTVRCAALGAEGPRTPSKTGDANLDCTFVKKHNFQLILVREKSTE